ncbi:LacI family DNA-binding transcriptional regulator [Rarobacter incanus]|uniref:LacI family transcriptional regulator n=1 Tax=Rarobacter incanus TaxID=153494 RepID=A0A542SPM0_9MICO|nr:LacI family DNA-binding transcriptional regulator [Rarobacter incanus]TQK76518.1 LacI family transcriptional regulator [Rarobacter incanus]
METDRVTIVDVAARAGVAISSASAALNGRPGVSEATRARVQRAASELGYVPSLRGRSLSTKRAFAIGFVLQRSLDVLESDPFFASFIGGIEQALSPRGYALVLHMGTNERDTENRYRELAANRRVDGVLLNELRVDDPRLPLMNEIGMPAVGIVPSAEGFELPCVRQPSAPGVAAMVRHLVDQGHTNIAHVSGPARFVHARERVEAWRAEMARHGLRADTLIPGDFTYQGGRAAADAISQMVDRPTAVVCANDLAAVGLIIRAQELGWDVPGDLSVGGYDGIAMGTYIRPTLSTVQAAPRRVAAAAANLLLDVIEDPAGSAGRVVDLAPGQLIVRHSTGKCPK